MAVRVGGVAVVVAVLAGCGGSGQRVRASSGWASASELRWLHQLGDWSQRLGVADRRFQAARNAAYRSFGGETLPALRRAAAEMQTACAPTPAQGLPSPPTPRLQPVLSGLEKACLGYGRVMRAIRTRRTAVVYGLLSNPLANLLRRTDDRYQAAMQQALLGRARPLPLTTAATTRSHVDPALGQIASQLAGHAVQVHCWAASDWRRLDREESALRGLASPARYVGWTPIDGTRIDLLARVCRQLEHLRHQPHSGAAIAGGADAVRVLAHESQHAAGDGEETVAECHALQRVTETARDLGVSARVAANISEAEWLSYPDEPAAYRTSACHNGGPLDLRPNDPHWP